MTTRAGHTAGEAFAIILARAKLREALQASVPGLGKITKSEERQEPKDPGTPDMFRRDIKTGLLILDRRDEVMGSRLKAANGETSARVRELVESGIGDPGVIAEKVGIAKNTVYYHLAKLTQDGVAIPEVPVKHHNIRRKEPGGTTDNKTKAIVTSCANCVHRPVCRLEDDRGWLDAKVKELQEKATEGLVLSYHIRCEYVVTKEALRIA